MIRPITLMLDTDTVEHLDWIRRQLSEKHGTGISKAQAITLLVQQDWKRRKIQELGKAGPDPVDLLTETV